MDSTITQLAVATLTVATALGCQAPAGEAATSDEDVTSASSGLWRLDGSPEPGDLELFQLTTRSFAGLVREVSPASAGALESARAPRADAEAPARTATGAVRRSGQRASLRPEGEPGELGVAAVGDALELTTPDGRVVRYRRTYGLYCVPDDRGVEATMLLELGKEPKLVAVNGDGITFPSEGTLPAKVKTDALFEDARDYVVTSRQGPTPIVVTLPFSKMTKREISGTIAVGGTTTPIACEPIDVPSP